MEGDFVVHHTTRKGSAVPMDQALEKACNKVAKSQSGIIGFSQRKQAVAMKNMKNRTSQVFYTIYVD